MLPRNQKQPPPGCAPVRDLMDERMRRVAEEIFSSAHKRAHAQIRGVPQKMRSFLSLGTG
jgi:hypothetical protein